MTVRFPAQRVGFGREDIEVIKTGIDDILSSGRLAMGEWVEEFERRWAGVCGTRHGVMTSGCTGALEIAVRALRLRGLRVACPINTYAATPMAILHAGANVAWVDCDPHDGMLDPAKLPKAEGAVDAVMVVHIGGNISPRLGEVIEYCRDRNLPLIEDAAHAHGVKSQWGEAGHIGRAGCFSFFATKLLTCAAESGILVTDDPEIAEFARLFRDQGRKHPPKGEDPQKLEHVLALAANYCPEEISAFIGCTQVDRLRDYLGARRAAAAVYREHYGLVESQESNFYKVITHDPVGRHPEVVLPGKVYKRPLHHEPAYAMPGLSLPGAERFCASHTALPIYGNMRPEEAEEVCRLLGSGA